MIGDRLKPFADTLPQDEKEALYALCEPNWDYEVVNIKKGEEGILMPIAFYYFNGRMAPLYTGEEIIWLNEIAPSGDPHAKCLRFPEQEAILKKYDALESEYSEIMKPYPWQWEMFCGNIETPNSGAGISLLSTTHTMSVNRMLCGMNEQRFYTITEIL